MPESAVILESKKYTMPSSKVSTVNLRFLPKLLNKRNIRRFIQDNLMGIVNGNCRVEIYIHLLDLTIDILYTLDSASNYSAIQKLKP